MKKETQGIRQKELIRLVAELYKLDPNVQQYLSVKFLGEETIHDLYESTKKEIEDEFFPNKGFGKMRLAKAKTAITNFKKLTNDHLRTVDLMLTYVEVGTEFTNTYGDIDEKFYSSMYSMYDKVVTECEKDEELFKEFGDRLYSVVIESDGIGWGYHDGLADLYYSISWVE
ncbi:DUF6155 family protein [Virgibacillus indicus]